jgi:hypothetical protein
MESPEQDLDSDLTPVPAPSAFGADPRDDDDYQEFRSSAHDTPQPTDSAQPDDAQPNAAGPLMEQARAAWRFADGALRRQIEERPYVVLAGAVGAGVLLGGGAHLAGIALRAGRRAAFNFALNQALDLVLPKVEKRS